jgi:hypothetical protein
VFADVSDATVNESISAFAADLLLNLHRRGQKGAGISDRHCRDDVVFASRLKVSQSEIVCDVHDLKDFRVVENDFGGVNVSDELPKVFMADVLKANERWRAGWRWQDSGTGNATNVTSFRA